MGNKNVDTVDLLDTWKRAACLTSSILVVARSIGMLGRVSSDRNQPVPSVVIYGDFNCPFSAVASARADRLSAAGRLRVDWRCVEHDRTIGPNETSLTPEQKSGFRAELDQVEELLAPGEPNRFRVPSRRLNTRDLNHIYVATPPAHRPGLRAALYDAYWFDDRDLTSDRVISEIIERVTAREPGRDDRTPADGGENTVAAWQREWEDLPQPIVPTMIIDHGYVSRGLGALARLASGSVSAPSPRQTASTGATYHADSPHPA
jgi:predicted DsbA family dithiol-disulfide isomerase